MKIGFTYDLRSKHQPDPDSPADFYGEFESEETVRGIIEALNLLGHDVIDIGNIKDLLRFCAAGKRVDLVFNMAEGRHGRARESQVPNLLEAYQIPYTFSDPLTLAICLDKGLTKKILADAQIPTAQFLVLKPDRSIDFEKVAAIGYPLFLKPLYEGASKGISEKAIVQTQKDLLARVTWLWESYKQPVLLEKYLPGKEFTVGVLGSGRNARVLGIMEVRLKENSPVYGFHQKENYTSLVQYHFNIAPALQTHLAEIALASWQTLECRDGGRVDIRLDENGQPHVLEINTLPGLHYQDSDLPIIAHNVGMSFEALLDEILYHTMQRMK